MEREPTGGERAEGARVGEPSSDSGVGGVSLDLFGTLVAVDRPTNPAEAVAAALAERGVDVPPDWPVAFGERHVEVPDGAELPLPEHVAAALASRTDALDPEAVLDDARQAVRAAFDADVRTRDGAAETVAALAERLPVGVLSNCSVPGLVDRALARSAVDGTALDAVTTSVGCGWRKPDPRAFEAAARGLGVDASELLHVGDDPVADGGASDAGATALVVESLDAADVLDAVEGRWE